MFTNNTGHKLPSPTALLDTDTTYDNKLHQNAPKVKASAPVLQLLQLAEVKCWADVRMSFTKIYKKCFAQGSFSFIIVYVMTKSQ